MHIQTSDQPTLALGFGDYTCNWGVHICGLYETEAERDEIVFGYLSAGDRAGDLQLYCPAERTENDFRRQFAAVCPDCAAHLDDSTQFQVMNVRDLYYSDGVFSPWAMDKSLNDFHHKAQLNSPRNIRATAEMVWALASVPGVEHLMAYEARLNYFYPGKPWVGICLYNLTKFSGAQIMNVLRTHPYSISGGVITENPYYQDPTEWLAAHAPQFLSPS